MATNTQHNGVHNSANQAATNGFSSGNTNSNGASSHDFESATRNMTHEEKATAAHAARFGYGPLAHIKTDTFDGAALQGDWESLSLSEYVKASRLTFLFDILQRSEVNSNPVFTRESRIANSPIPPLSVSPPLP